MVIIVYIKGASTFDVYKDLINGSCQNLLIFNLINGSSISPSYVNINYGKVALGWYRDEGRSGCDDKHHGTTVAPQQRFIDLLFQPPA